MSDKKESNLLEALKQMYRDMYTYMVSKDTQKLAALLDTSFVLHHMTGMCQTQKEYLHYIKNGTLNYYSAEHESISVVINGNNAVLTGQSKVKAAVFGGGKNLWRLQQRIRFQQIEGSWKMVEAVASTY